MTAAAFDDSKWRTAVVQAGINVPLSPTVGPPVRGLMQLKPVKLNRFGNTWVVDFGQNMVGHVKLTAHGEKRATR